MWRDCRSHPASFCRHAGSLFPSRASVHVQLSHGCLSMAPELTCELLLSPGAACREHLRVPSAAHSSTFSSHTGSVRATPQTLVQSLSLKAETQQSRKFQIKLCRKLVCPRWVEMPPVMVSHSQFLNSRLPSTQPEQSEATFPSDFLIFCMLSCAYVVVGRKFLRTCVCVF